MRQRSLYRALADGLENAVALLRPGVRASDVYAAAMAAERSPKPRQIF
jgi:Xaa-Pro aminopeptidase